jgi:hypothetical protein
MSAPETVSNIAELDALPDFAVVVSAPAELDGNTVVIAAQKVGGDWFCVGSTYPMPINDLTTTFFPASVVYRLAEAAPGGVG